MANDDLEHYVPIEIENLLAYADSGVNRFNQHPYICTVPSLVRDLSPDSFKPQLVSIGPLHKQDTNLKEMEDLKKFYLRDLLYRSTSPPNQSKKMFKECLQRVNAKIDEIKSSYAATEYSDAELADMMVMDGSFILEFCLKRIKREKILLNKIQTFRIAIDLMLLENQIPFFVLQAIFDCIIGESIEYSLTSLLHNVLSRSIHPFKIPHDEFSVTDVSTDQDHDHVLDCLHKIYQFKSLDGRTPLNYNHSVVELHRSGVNFKPQEEKNKAMAMNIIELSSCFLCPRSNLTLVMPTFTIQDSTEVILRNFIAYEQFSPQKNYFFTSYAIVMDMLIDNQADVGILVESQILVNNLGSHKEAAKVINSICKNIVIQNFCYTKEIKALDHYYTSYWPNIFAHLKRTYFNSPWSLIALVAGITLFVLSVVQTVFTVMSYNP